MRSLFSKVFLAHLLTLLIALATISILLSTAFHSLYMQLAEKELVWRAERIAQRISPFVDDPAQQDELAALIRLMEASSNTHICLVVPLGQQGTVVGGPGARASGDAGPVAGQISPGEAKVASGSDVIPCGGDMLVARVTLPSGRGSLLMGTRVTAVVDATVGKLRGLVIYAGLVAVALSLLVAVGLSERISGPLRRMRRLAGRMAEGDFSQRLDMKAHDEVGELGRSFDSLADSLRNTLQELQQEQARLRGILTSVAEGIIAVDAQGRVALLNPQAAGLLGVGQVPELGLPIDALAGLPQDVAELFHRCLERNRLCTTGLKLENPRRDLTLQVAPIPGREGELRGAVAVLRDVTESRRLEEMRRRFISDASHEIRTPLTAIGGFAAAVADGTAATEEEQRRSASLIVREVERLSRLVNDLLDLSRIESGAVGLTLEEVDLKELIPAAVESLEAQARERGISVQVELPSDLPSVRADSDRIYQVVVNLVSNAIRFNRDGGSIVVTGRQTDGQVQVEVRDTGSGIEPDQLPQIWERFHRADLSRARQVGGTGLGLAIVRSIVEAHGGSVSAESTPGKGSTFSFVLSTT